MRSLQPWDILLIYCNNQLKKYVIPFPKTSEGGILCPPTDVYVRSFLSFFTLIKLLHKSSWVIKPGLDCSLYLGVSFCFASHSWYSFMIIDNPVFALLWFISLSKVPSRSIAVKSSEILHVKVIFKIMSMSSPLQQYNTI